MFYLKRIDQHDLPLPEQATPFSAGYDFRTRVDMIIRPGGTEVLPTGFAWQLPPGTVGYVRPRSGLAVRSSIDVLAGVIDSDYRGEVCVVLVNHGLPPVRFKAGDRIAQMVVHDCYSRPTEEVAELDDSERGEGGFGHTGIN